MQRVPLCPDRDMVRPSGPGVGCGRPDGRRFAPRCWNRTSRIVMSDSAFEWAPTCGDYMHGKGLSPMARLTYTVNEVAELLGISRTSAYECVRRGDIPAIELGRRLVIARTTVERLLNPTTTD